MASYELRLWMREWVDARRTADTARAELAAARRDVDTLRGRLAATEVAGAVLRAQAERAREDAIVAAAARGTVLAVARRLALALRVARLWDRPSDWHAVDDAVTALEDVLVEAAAREGGA